jgi:dTDP-4-dehydrorhamnose 3,5-epimerase
VKVRELGIPDAYEISTDVFPDDRGLFVNPFRAQALAEAIGRPLHVRQTNHSASKRGVVRGVHFSMLPPGQAKYVYVPRGAVLDIVVDIRIGSPTYGQHDVVRLDDRDFGAIYLSEGLGHCAVALEDDTVLSYLCSTEYDPGREKGVSPTDPALALPMPADALLSARDTGAPTLAEAAEQGLLPTYETCKAFYASLR